MYDTVYVTTLSDAPALPSSRHNRAFIIAPMQQLIGESKCRRQATPVTIREATNFKNEKLYIYYIYIYMSFRVADLISAISDGTLLFYNKVQQVQQFCSLIIIIAAVGILVVPYLTKKSEGRLIFIVCMFY